MSTLTTPEPVTTRRRSKATLLIVAAGAAVLVAGVAIALALFQPWKLWVDEKVDEAAPAGATVITITPTTVAPVAPTTIAAAAPSAPTTPAAPPSTTVAPATALPPASMLVSLDHTTRGNVVLLADAARQRFLRFEDLDTSNGPDLKVYLSTNPTDGPEGQFDDDFVDLGRLQGNVGNQNYAIPADVDLARFRSVVIWCDRFNSAFGAAALS